MKTERKSDAKWMNVGQTRCLDSSMSCNSHCTTSLLSSTFGLPVKMKMETFCIKCALAICNFTRWWRSKSLHTSHCIEVNETLNVHVLHCCCCWCWCYLLALLRCLQLIAIYFNRMHSSSACMKSSSIIAGCFTLWIHRQSRTHIQTAGNKTWAKTATITNKSILFCTRSNCINAKYKYLRVLLWSNHKWPSNECYG